MLSISKRLLEIIPDTAMTEKRYEVKKGKNIYGIKHLFSNGTFVGARGYIIWYRDYRNQAIDYYEEYELKGKYAKSLSLLHNLNIFPSNLRFRRSRSRYILYTYEDDTKLYSNIKNIKDTDNLADKYTETDYEYDENNNLHRIVQFDGQPSKCLKSKVIEINHEAGLFIFDTYEEYLKRTPADVIYETTHKYKSREYHIPYKYDYGRLIEIERHDFANNKQSNYHVFEDLKVFIPNDDDERIFTIDSKKETITANAIEWKRYKLDEDLIMRFETTTVYSVSRYLIDKILMEE